MTDRSLVPANFRRMAPQIYLSALKRARHCQRRLSQFCWDTELRIFPTSPSLVERCCAEDWLLVGDAASTLDPLCSQGVQKAIASALTGVTVVHTLLVHPERSQWVMDFCRERQLAGFLSHVATRRNYYRRERRFSKEPFWQQRAGAGETTSADKIKGRMQISPLEQSRIEANSELRIEDRPVIESEFVEVRPVVLAPQLDRGVRYCGDVCAPDLIQLVSDRPAFPALLSRYRRLHGDISDESFSRAIAGLMELRLLQAAV